MTQPPTALHDPHSRGFASDNYAGIHPEVLAAIGAANGGHQVAYGEDVYTARLGEVLDGVFGRPVQVYPVFNGTGANVLALQAATHRWASVLTTGSAHIHVDEAAAPERVGGLKVNVIDTPDGKLTPELIEAYPARAADEHFSQIGVVSITNSTEVGTVYSPEEIRAIAEVVLGVTEPAGRLPVSFARHVGQQPTYYNQIRGQHNDRYADLTQRPKFLFGEGLSYTTVEYADLALEATSLGLGDTVRATVRVTNTGSRRVRETVQVYVSDTVTSVSWADKELKTFRQVDLAAGESAVVDIELAVAACTIVNARGDRVVESGAFELRVGPSSDEERLLRAVFEVR